MVVAGTDDTLRGHGPHEAVDRSLSALAACRAPGVALHLVYAGKLRWTGVPQIHTPPYFWAPRCREGDDELLCAAIEDAATWADARFVQRQAWWRPDIGFDDPEEYDRRITAWDRSQELLPPVRPNRRLCLPLLAAHAHDIGGLSTRWAIGRLLRMRGTPDPRSDDVLPRYKGTPAIVVRGRRLAAALGAWPWAAFDADALTDGWWADDLVVDVLRCWVNGVRLEPDRHPYPGFDGDVLIPLFPL